MARRELSRCATHGLAYDPEIQDGCTLCRNSLRPRPSSPGQGIAWKDIAMVVLMAMWVGGVLSVTWFGVERFKDFREKVRAEAAGKEPGEKAPMPPAPKDEASLWDRANVPVPKELPMIRRPGVDHDGYPRNVVDKVGLLALLRAREFDALGEHLARLQKEFESDFHKEEQVTQAFDAFDSADATVGERIDEWVREAPFSFAPHLARAQHQLAVGWYYRGGDYSNKTKDERLEKFQEFVRAADADVDRALALNQKLVVGYQTAIWISAYHGIGSRKREMLEAATAVCPECFRVRSKYLLATTPRWSGKLEDMEQFAAEAQKFADRNPRLKALLGYADEDRADAYMHEKKLAAAIDAIDRALAASDFHRFHKARADILFDMERRKEAFEEMEKAIDQDPQNDQYLRIHGRLLIESGKFREGTDELKTATLLDPVSADTRWFNDYAVKQLVQQGFRLRKSGDASGSKVAYDLALELAPANGDALARQAGGSDDTSEVARLEAAAAADPTNFDVYKRLDDELVKTREFGRIVSHWNRYIASKPDDARAFLERGGANFHAGNTAEAIADLDHACASGLQEGCRGAQSVRARTR